MGLEAIPDIDSAIGGFVTKFYDLYGASIDTITIGRGRDQIDYIPRKGSRYRVSHDDYFLDLNILESLSLLRNRSFQNVSYKSHDISVNLYTVTPLAIDLFAACNPHLIQFRNRKQHA